MSSSSRLIDNGNNGKPVRCGKIEESESYCHCDTVGGQASCKTYFVHYPSVILGTAYSKYFTDAMKGSCYHRLNSIRPLVRRPTELLTDGLSHFHFSEGEVESRQRAYCGARKPLGGGQCRRERRFACWIRKGESIRQEQRCQPNHAF